MELADLFGCKDRVAIVSGGAGLYGFAISEALCMAGAHVIVASRSDQRFASKAAQLKESYSIRHYSLDLRSEKSIAETFDRAMREFGRVDIVVNNALTPVGRTLEQTSVTAWQDSMQGNILGLYLMSRHAAKIMQAQKSGSIINISSIYGVVAPDFQMYAEAGSGPNPVDYGFIKGGMVMFTKTLASYLGPDQVRVNCIVPGGINDDTDTPAYVAAYQRKVPLRRWARPNDIMGAVIFLASDAASYVTGATIAVDGGYTAL
jgi:NAD(P)-dependent dehydrogenase (short-subunit alcohol dehydrogenase family)